jgi:DNA segregation ATPase FtsK/SpoIIIE, S-DNA-T family
LSPTSPPGRAMQVGMAQELQLAILGDNINVAAQSRMIDQLAEFLATIEAPKPFEIRLLPAEISASSMPATVAGLPVLGVADESLEPVSFNPVGASLVWGPIQSGRTNAMRWFAESLRAWRPDLPLVLVSSRRSPLSGLAVWTTTATGVDECEKVLDKILPIVAEENTGGDPVMALFVEGYPEFLSSRVENRLIDVVKAIRSHDHIVIAEGESSTWNSSWPLLSEVRNARSGLLLQPEYTDGDTVLRTALPRFKKGEPPAGRGYWIRAGKFVKVQVPLAGD